MELRFFFVFLATKLLEMLNTLEKWCAKYVESKNEYIKLHDYFLAIS